MAKWADFLISAAKYSSDHTKIIQVKQHPDLDGNVGEGELVDKRTVSSNIKNGKTYRTIFNGGPNDWTKGDIVRTYSVDGEFFIRADKNKVNLDNLGLLNEF